MELPKLNQSITTTLSLPISKKEVLFRPFLVKEEKILLVAQQSAQHDGKQEQIYLAIKQIIQNCDVEGALEDVESLPLAEIEYIFLFLRAISVDSKIEVTSKHPEGKNAKGEECSGTMIHEINLGDIFITNKEAQETQEVSLTEEGSLTLHLPNMKTIAHVRESGDEISSLLTLIASHIVYFTEGETIYKKNDFSAEKWIEFLENFSQPQLEKVGEFFQNAPKMRYEKTYVCPKCGEEEKIELEGLSDFL